MPRRVVMFPVALPSLACRTSTITQHAPCVALFLACVFLSRRIHGRGRRLARGMGDLGPALLLRIASGKGGGWRCVPFVDHEVADLQPPAAGSLQDDGP